MVYSTEPRRTVPSKEELEAKGLKLVVVKGHWHVEDIRPIRRGVQRSLSKETQRSGFRPLSLHNGFTNEDLKNTEVVKDDQTLGKMLLDTEAIEDIKETVHDILRIVQQIRFQNTRKELRR